MKNWVKRHLISISGIYSLLNTNSIKIKTIEICLLIYNSIFSLFLIYFLAVNHNFSIASYIVLQLVISILIYFLIKRKLISLASIIFAFLPSLLFLFFPVFYNELDAFQHYFISNTGTLFATLGIIIFSFQKEKALYITSVVYGLLYVFISDIAINSFATQDHLYHNHHLALGICSKFILFILFFVSIFLYKEIGYVFAIKLNMFYERLKHKNKEYIGLVRKLNLANDERNNSMQAALDKNAELEKLTTELLHQRETLQSVLISFKKQEEELDKNYQNSLEKETKIKEQYAELMISKEEIDAQNEMILKQQFSLLEKNKALEMYTKALLYLNKTKKVNSITLVKKLKDILVTCAETLDARYVSIWTFDSQKNAIVCIQAYDKQENTFNEGEIFYAKDYPIYFSNIQNNHILKADRAQTSVELSEFLQNYLIPKNIHSLLDAPYYLNGEFGGIICIEIDQKFRNWSNEEIFFSKSLTEILSNTFMELQNSDNEEKILLQTSELNKKNELLEQQKYEIENIKNYLEERIKDRTFELQQKNTKLTEIAKTNSIILKKPLHRILGLCYIMQEQYHEISEIQECLSHLKISSKELEVAVDQINEMLNRFD